MCANLPRKLHSRHTIIPPALGMAQHQSQAKQSHVEQGNWHAWLGRKTCAGIQVACPSESCNAAMLGSVAAKPSVKPSALYCCCKCMSSIQCVSREARAAARLSFAWQGPLASAPPKSPSFLWRLRLLAAQKGFASDRKKFLSKLPSSFSA